ncbi:hypothetical protein YC2023_053801 [Brassica napus]
MGRSQDKLEKMQLRQSYRNIVASRVCVVTPYMDLVFHTYFEREHFTMTCQGTLVVVDTCLVVVGVEKASALNFVLPLRDLCSVSTKSLAFSLLSLALLEVMNSLKLLSFFLAWLIWFIARSARTQHKIEMDKRDGVLGSQPMSVPPAQQMSRVDQPTPPYAGYPPATGYPQPYYPQPGHGYPPAPGYPPPGHGYPPAPGYPPPGHGYPPAPGYPPPGHGYPPAPDYPSK